MVEKGEKIGECRAVVRRSPSQFNEVNSQISIEDLDVGTGETYVVEWYQNDSGSMDRLGCTVSDVYSTNKGITLPRKIIKENDIKPGQVITARVHEASEGNGSEQSIVEGGEFSDLATIVKDSYRTDGIDSSIASEPAWKYLKRGGELLEFTNPDTGDSYVAKANAHKNKYNITFPYEARREIDAEPGGVVEISPGDEDPNLTDGGHEPIGDMEPLEILKEVHRMVREIEKEV